MSQRFEEQIIVVTGGAQGIGFAAAKRFLADGAEAVVLLDSNEAALRDAVDRLGERARSLRVDISDEGEVRRAFAQVWEWYGRLNVVFANAGISGQNTRVADLTVEGLQQTLGVNLVGAFLALREGLRFMPRSEGPRSIVTMSSSMAGWDVLDGGADYAASKFGVLGLTRVAALEAAPMGVRVNAVCPGVISTKLGVPDLEAEGTSPTLQKFDSRIPLGKAGTPEEVASTVCFLASEDASHITGAGFLIDGGQTLRSWANSP